MRYISVPALAAALMLGGASLAYAAGSGMQSSDAGTSGAVGTTGAAGTTGTTGMNEGTTTGTGATSDAQTPRSGNVAPTTPTTGDLGSPQAAPGTYESSAGQPDGTTGPAASGGGGR